jgi:hypothetical protein
VERLVEAGRHKEDPGDIDRNAAQSQSDAHRWSATLRIEERVPSPQPNQLFQSYIDADARLRAIVFPPLVIYIEQDASMPRSRGSRSL